jgi:hypothetical protein
VTLILPQYNKSSIFNKLKMKSLEDIVAYLADLDKDIQKLGIALRPDKVVDLVDADPITTDVAVAIHFRVVLTAAVGATRVLANPTNGRDGQRVVWEFVQSATGSNAITLDTKWAVGADIASVTLSTTANAIDFMGAVYDAPNDKWRIVAYVMGYA